MDLKTFLSIARRWIWLLILATVVGAGLGYYDSNRQTPIYQASTTFTVLRPSPTTYADNYYSIIDSQQLIVTYTQLLSSESLLAAASEELGFPVSPGQATATQVGESQFVVLSVRDTDPEKAALIANILVKVLIDQNEQLQSVRYVTAEGNLQNRIDQAEAQIELLQSQINQLSAETVALQKTEVEDQIAVLEPQIADLDYQISQIDPLDLTEENQKRLSAYRAQLNRLQSTYDAYQDILTDLEVRGKPIEDGSEASAELQQLNSTLNLYKQIYVSSINSLETARLSRAQNMGTVVQIESAYPPRRPISPRPTQAGLMSGAIGLLAAAGVAFLIEYLDDTLKTPDDVESTLNLPVLGYVAELGMGNNGGDKAMNGRFVDKHPRSPVSEAFRALRTNLEFAAVNQPLSLILITSGGASEGKTTIAANLALILGQDGKRVLLLDGDMRKPTLHQQFGINNRSGLSDVLRGQWGVAEVIQNSGVSPNVDVLTSGSLPPNPAELLGSDRMGEILESLRGLYDKVIIDCSPMLVVDSQILSSKVDGIIFVIRPGKTHASNAVRPMEELKRVGARVLGVVMNRIPRNREYYYGGYNYYSPYGSDDGYHHVEKEEEGGRETEDRRPGMED